MQIVQAVKDGLKGKKTMLSGKCDREERDIENMITEWSARYRIILMSRELLSKYRERIKTRQSQENPEQYPMLAKGNAEDYDLLLKKTGRIEQMHWLCESAEIFPDLYNESAAFEMERFLNKILSGNGVKPFMLGLDRKDTLTCMNMLTRIMVDYVDYEGLEELECSENKIEDFSVSLKTQIEHFAAYIREGNPITLYMRDAPKQIDREESLET